MPSGEHPFDGEIILKEQQETQKNENFLELSSLFSLFLFDLNSFFPCFFSIFCFLNQVKTEVLVETMCKSECEPEL